MISCVPPKFIKSPQQMSETEFYNLGTHERFHGTRDIGEKQQNWEAI
jgi:hypothetical protein